MDLTIFTLIKLAERPTYPCFLLGLTLNRQFTLTLETGIRIPDIFE